MLECELVRELVGRAAQDRRVAEGVQRGAPAQRTGLSKTSRVCLVWRCGFKLEKGDIISAINDLRNGRYPRLNWFYGSAGQCVPQSGRARNPEVAEVGAAQGPQDRAGASSGVRAGVCRVGRVVFPTKGATDLSWQDLAEGRSCARHTIRESLRGRGPYNVHPGRRLLACRVPCHARFRDPGRVRNCWLAKTLPNRR